MKSPLTQFIIVSLVCITSIIGYGFWYSAVKAKSASVALLENQIVTKKEAEKHAASTQASLIEISGDEASMRGYFISETDIVAFINDLETQGQKQKATVEVVSVSTSATSVQSVLAFTLVVTGTFDAVMRTIGAIEYAPYDLSVSALSITKDKGSDWRASLNLLVGLASAETATSSSAQALFTHTP